MARDIVGRVQRLLLSPKSEWDVIDGESIEPQSLATGYVAPLAAIPAVAAAVGWSVFGVGPVRIGLGSALAMAATQYVLAVVFVFVFAFIIDALAPTFGARKNFNQALKISAYSATAWWIAGVFMIVPMLGVIAVVGSIYSLYLLFIGLPKLMKPAAGKETAYTIVSIVTAIAVMIVIGAVSRSFVPTPAVNGILSLSEMDHAEADALGDLAAVMPAGLKRRSVGALSTSNENLVARH